jgi:hypothetical protein
MSICPYDLLQGSVETYNMDEDAWRVDSVENSLTALNATGDVIRARLYFTKK